MEHGEPGGPTTSRSDRSAIRGNDRIRIGIVDDHHLVREGLRLVLGGHPDLEVVGEAATRSEAFELVEAARPDVVLLDLALPEGDGIALLRELRARDARLRFVVVTMDGNVETVRQSLVAGASAYIVKGAHSHELVEAIRAVARGERYLHSSVTAAIVDDSIRLSRSGLQLTVREREIIGHLAAGHSPAQVGRLLGISVHTVRRHIANLSAKLGLRGQAALVRYAIQHGLVRAG
jgi:DNA-binding NarL/FixJ family response regulator